MDAHQLDRIAEYLKEKQFKLGALYGWGYHAVILKLAADKLYDQYHAAIVRIVNRTFEEFGKDNVHHDGARTLVGEELQDIWDAQLLSIYYLLIGFAIENLLKGILMSRNPENYLFSTKLKFRNHALLKLCTEDCQITVDDSQQDLLGMLEAQIVWMGRYPTPLDQAKMLTYRPSVGPIQAEVRKIDSRKEQEEVDVLYLQIYSEYEAAKLNRK